MAEAAAFGDPALGGRVPNAGLYSQTCCTGLQWIGRSTASAGFARTRSRLVSSNRHTDTVRSMDTGTWLASFPGVFARRFLG